MHAYFPPLANAPADRNREPRTVNRRLDKLGVGANDPHRAGAAFGMHEPGTEPSHIAAHELIILLIYGTAPNLHTVYTVLMNVTLRDSKLSLRYTTTTPYFLSLALSLTIPMVYVKNVLRVGRDRLSRTRRIRASGSSIRSSSPEPPVCQISTRLLNSEAEIRARYVETRDRSVSGKPVNQRGVSFFSPFAIPSS